MRSFAVREDGLPSRHRTRRLFAATAIAIACAAAAPALAAAAAPTGVTAIALDSRVELAWQPTAGASSYAVYRGLSKDTITTQVSPVGGVVTTGFADAGAVDGTTYYYAVRAVVTGVESPSSATVAATPLTRSCSAGNTIAIENCYAGTSAWNSGGVDATLMGNGGIEGFATATSINGGGSFAVKLQTQAATTADVEIYRSGYYQGRGGRLISVLKDVPVGAQPACASDATTGKIDCSNWSVGATVTTSSTWPSGVYLIRLVRSDDGAAYEFPIVVRNDANHAAAMYGIPFTTYEAYNHWGGKSLYAYNSSGAATVTGSAQAAKVSFDRPWSAPQGDQPATNPNWYAHADYPWISWLEQSGYDVTYASTSDLDTNQNLPRSVKAFIAGAHDEYYSTGMRNALTLARDAGVNLFFAGSNTIYWRIRLEDGGRTVVCYKTTETQATDPGSPVTSLWRDPNGANQPENAVVGEMYVGDEDQQYFPLTVTAAQGADRVWRYTGLDTPANGTSTSIGTDLVGWEWDKRSANGFEPNGVKTLSGSVVTGNILASSSGGYLSATTTTSNAAKYTAPSGALVFATGTNHWAHGLASTADSPALGSPDLRIQQATTNVLEDMGAQPATPGAGITLDSGSAPRVVSTAPADAATTGTTTTVSATFSTAMDATTITSSSFALRASDGTVVPSSLAYDAPTLTATLTPNAALAAGAYTARVETTVTSATGRALQTAVSWSFSVAAFIVTSTSPADGAQGALQDSAVTATFSAAADPATITPSSYTLTDSTGASVAATVSYDAATFTASLRPNAALTAGASYTAHLSTAVHAAGGAPLQAPVAWSFRTNACPCLLFASNPTPDILHISTANGRSGGPFTLEVGVKIRVDSPTRLSAARFYKDSLETGTHVARLWNATGTQVAQVAFAGETASGWQRQTFPAPPLLQPNTTYTLSVNANANFVQTFSALAPQIDSGPLHSVADGQNGVYGDSAGAFPTQSFNSSSYFVDPEVVPDGELLPISVATTAPTAANGISPDARVRATFTRSVDPSTLTSSSFSVTDANGTPVLGTIAYDDPSLTATFIPSAPLALATTYSVRLTTAIKSTTGSPIAAPVTFSFTTAATAPPPLAVDTVIPSTTATSIGASIRPRAHFTKPLDASTVGPASFTLTGPAGAVAANVTYDSSAQTAILAPQAPLTLGATYTAHLADTVEATDGTRLGGGYAWSFTVAATAPGPPTVSSTSPASGATSVALAAQVGVTFSASMDPSTISAGTVTVAQPFSPPVAATVAYDDATKTATITPSSPLARSSEYLVRVDPSVAAADGTAVGTAFSSNFYTSACTCALYFDTDTPAMSGIPTANGDGNGSVSLELGVKIAVDVPMLLKGFRFYKSPGETGVHTGRLWTGNGILVTQQDFTNETASGWQTQPVATPYELLPGVVYVVSVNANQYFVQTFGALETSIISGPMRTVPDGANMVYGSAAGAFPNQTFRTSSYFIDLNADVEGTPAPPTVTPTPANAATLVPATTTVRARFSQSVNPATLDTSTFTLTRDDGTAVAATVTYDDATSTAILTPSVALAPSRTYTARLAASVKARDGVPLGTPYTWTFTTSPPSPTVTAASPADGATNVARNAKVQLTFSKPLDATTLGGIGLANTNGAVATTTSYDAATSTVTLTPSALLAVSTSYSTTVPTTVTATDGSAVAAPLTFAFTTTSDATAPVTTISSGPAATTNQSSATFVFAGDETATFECKLDAGAWLACASPDTISSLAAGAHTFSVRATDTAGNLGAASTWSWTIDTSAPKGGTLVGGGPGPIVTSTPPAYTNSTSATFAFATDEPATFTCALDGGAPAACTSPAAYTALAAGAHAFTIVATDFAGNSSAPETHNWTIDLAAPVTTDDAPATPQAGAVTVALSPTDTGGSGVAQTEYKIGSGAYVVGTTVSVPAPADHSNDGTTTIAYRSTDGAGNVEAPKTATVTIDTLAPVTADDAPTAWQNGPVTVHLAATDATSGVASTQVAVDGGAFSTAVSALVSGEGVHTVTYRSTDRAGNIEATRAATVRIDLTAPVTTDDAPAGWSTGAVTLHLAATDAASGVASTEYKIDGAATYAAGISALVGGDGTHTVAYRSTDAAGNVESAHIATVRIDGIGPATTIDCGGSCSGFLRGPVNVTLAAVDNSGGSGIDHVAYSVDGGTTWLTYVAPFAVATTTDVSYRAYDVAGNVETTRTQHVAIDNTAPTTAIACNAGSCGGWFTTAPVSVSLASTDASGSGIASTAYSTDGGTTWLGYTSAFPLSSTTTVLYRASDNAGNVEQVRSQLVQIDVSPPTTPALTFANLANASVTGSTLFARDGVAGQFDLGASSSDGESHVASYQLPQLGSGWSLSGSTYSFTAAAVDPAEPLNVTATNNAGLVSAPAGFAVTKDATAPVTAASCNGAACGSGWYSSAVTFALAANDGAGSGVVSTIYTLDGTDPTPLHGSLYLGALTLSASTTVKARSYDAVGNEENVGTWVLQIDPSAPTNLVVGVDDSSPNVFTTAGGTTYYNSNVASQLGVSATAGDLESGVARVDFPSIAGFTGGGSDTTAPFSASYATSVGASAAGTQAVRAYNAAGLSTAGSFAVAPDGAAPTGGSISYVDGFTPSTSIALTIDDGSDAGSGLDTSSRKLEQQTAPLVDGSCGAYGSWGPATNPATIASGNCARFRELISDNVANQAAYTSPNVAKIDNGVPTIGALVVTEASPLEYLNGTQVFYNPSAGNSGSFDVSMTATAASGVARVNFPSLAGHTGGGDDATAPYSTTYSWIAGATATGSKNVTAYSNAGGQNTSTFSVTPDTTAPTGQTIAVTGGPWFTTKSITLTTTDGSDDAGGAGLDPATKLLERRSTSLVDGVCGTTWSAWAPASSPDTTVLGGNCYQYGFSVADNVSNRSARVTTATQMVDDTPPAAPVVNLTAGANASISGQTAFFRLGAPGTLNVDVVATDAESAIASISRPTLGSGWTLVGNQYSFTASAADPVEPNNVTATNNAGLTSAATGFAVTGDGAGPAGGSVVYADGYRTAASVGITLDRGSDALSGVDTSRGLLQRASASMTEGACGIYGAYTTIATNPGASYVDTSVTSGSCYQYQYVVYDNVGNQSTYTSANAARVDTIAPTATMADPGAYLRGTISLASATADTGGSGIATVAYQVNGGSGWNAVASPLDTHTLLDGTYDFRAVATDRAGNQTASVPVTARVIDNTAPSAVLADPGANLRRTITLAATTSDAGSGIATTVFQQRPAGGTFATIPAAFDTTTVADGLYDFQVVATDKAGNQTTSVVSGRRIDNTAPTPTMGALAATVRGTVTLTSNTADAGSGVNTVTYQRRPSGGATWTDTPAIFDTTTVADGSYDFQVVATDNAGNSATAPFVTTYVDNNGPRVTSTTPAAGASGVSTTTAVSFVWSRAMDTTTLVAANAYLTDPSGATVGGTLTYDATTLTSTFTPSASLAGSATYAMHLTTAIKAANGFALHDPYTWSFSTGAAPAPTVTSTSPANGATAVAASTAVTAGFSIAMDATSFTSTSFTLVPSGGTAVAATLSYNATTFTATLQPSAALAAATTYTATLTTAVRSSQGTPLTSAVSWTFTTATSAPTVTSVTPAAGTTGVSRATKPTATFSTAMDATTITSSSFTLKDTSNVLVAASVTYNATTRTATLSPTTSLKSLMTYTATLTTAVKSSTGAPLAAAFTWRFQTAAPTVTQTAPGGSTTAKIATFASTSAAGTAVPEQATPWSPVRVTFSEPMDPATITTTNFGLNDANGNAVAGSVSYDAPTMTAVFQPNNLLKWGASYTVHVDTTILAALDAAPLYSPVTWTFTTTLGGNGVGIDSGSSGLPYYVATDGDLFLPDNKIASGGTTRAIAATIAGTTDPQLYATERDGVFTYQASVPLGAYDVKLYFADTESTAAGQRVFSVDVTDTTVAPDIANLDIFNEVGANTADVKTIPNVQATQVGNSSNANITIKTIAGVGTPVLAAVELTPLPPAVTSTTPAANATGVALKSSVSATFTTPMDGTSLNATTFKLTAPNGTTVPATISLNVTGRIATLAPSAALAASTVYTATIDAAARSLGGLPIGTSVSWSFKTGTK